MTRLANSHPFCVRLTPLPHQNWTSWVGNAWVFCPILTSFIYLYNIIWYEFIYIPLYEIFVQITSKRFGTTYYRPVTGHKQSKATTGWWVPTSHKALVLMRAPYRTRLLKCPPVVGAGFEPRSSDREFDPLTTRLTWYVIIEQEVAPLQISRNSPTLALASLTVTQLSPLTSEHRRLRDRRDFALDLVGVPEE